MKKILSGVLATALVASMASMSVFAAGATAGTVYNGDLDKTLTEFSTSNASKIVGDGVVPTTTFNYGLGGMTDKAVTADVAATGVFTKVSSDATVRNIGVDYLTDSDYFKFKLDKNDNAKMINSVSVVTDKKLASGFSANQDRSAFLKFVLNDSDTTSEIKSTGTVYFTARKDLNDKGQYFKSGDEIAYNYTLWINNKKISGSDGDAGTGDRVFFSPASNDKNTFVWGDDRAALEFNADDDASSFYCRLSTSNNANIYAEYGDPVGANLWFFDFVGNKNIPATSRANLTLGIPWNQDADLVPNMADISIYTVDADGMLLDVTDEFKYSEDGAEIEGWTTQTRVLGSYIMSDTPLEMVEDEIVDEEVTDEIPDTDIVVDTPTKPIPNTGSSDMVSVAVVAAVVSLAAAGAVAFKKASK